MKNTENQHNKKSKWKKLLAKFGIWGIVFFTIKGIISTILIYFLGKNFWEVIQDFISDKF